jgi:glycosyltransferase involved in cell wall biosynthesis
MKTNKALNLSKTVACDFDKNIVLSVSMIVKNEELMLGACLEGIKPLLEAIPSELIIIDTGSTDRTVEVAKNYTDKVFHFDWVNDFAAARNFGLEKCRGQWFMFLDADEHFQDVSDMVEFFGNEKIQKDYNSAYFPLRNFTTSACDSFFGFYVQRVARRAGDLCFKGAIHEYFPKIYMPAYYFKSYANHYGYSFQTEKEYEDKLERNLTLLKEEYEKNPNDLRTIHHYFQVLVKPSDEKRAISEKAVALADKSSDPVSYTAYFDAYKMHNSENRPEKALEAMDKVLKSAKPNNAILTEAYACRAGLLFGFGNYAEAEKSYRKYLEYYKKQENNQLDMSVMSFVITNHVTPEKRDYFVNQLAVCLSKQNKTADAIAVYCGISLDALTPKAFRDAAGTVFEIVKTMKSKDEKEPSFKTLAALYDKVSETKDEEKINYFEQMLESIYFLSRAENLFAESFKAANGRFAELMQLCMNKETAALEAFINSFDPLPEGYSAAIELALKLNVNLGEAIAKMNLELIRAHLAAVAKSNALLPMQAVAYQSEQFFFQSVKNLLFGALLFEAACFNAEMLTESQKSEVYNGCVKYCSLYVGNVYNPDLLNEDDISVLPESHRFGYFMGSAKKLLADGDKLGYVRELKKALASCNSMQNVIKYLIEEFSSTL